MIDKFLGWKGWAVGIGLLGAALGFLKLWIDHLKAEAKEARQQAANAEKRYQHKEATTEAEREAVSEGDKRMTDAVEKAKRGDRTHFE